MNYLVDRLYYPGCRITGTPGNPGPSNLSTAGSAASSAGGGAPGLRLLLLRVVVLVATTDYVVVMAQGPCCPARAIIAVVRHSFFLEFGQMNHLVG